MSEQQSENVIAVATETDPTSPRAAEPPDAAPTRVASPGPADSSAASAVNDLRGARDALLTAYRAILARVATTDPRATEELATLAKAVANLVDNDFAERLVFGGAAD